MQIMNISRFSTISPAYSLICMTSLTKTIVHIYGPWAISVPPYDMYSCTVHEILCLQAFLDKITLSSAHYMHINDIQHFEIIKTWILANNMTMPNMKQNRHVVVKLWRFHDFYIKPRLLINMHDIANKNNSAHLRAISVPPYDMYPLYRSWNFVFTSFF